MSTTNTKHTLEHPVTLAPLYRSEYRDDMTKARDAKGRRVSTEALVDGLESARARIAELERTLAAVTAQRDQCKADLLAISLMTWNEREHGSCHGAATAARDCARAALRACDDKGGAL